MFLLLKNLYIYSTMDTILSEEQYTYLYMTSWVSLVSCIYAAHRQHYDLAVVPGSVFLSSINYWRYPDYSWRRYADMAVVHAALLYQLVRTRKAEYRFPYYGILSVGLIAYPIGWYSYTAGSYWMSVYMHMVLHIAANLGNLVLYSGSIDPPALSS